MPDAEPETGPTPGSGASAAAEGAGSVPPPEPGAPGLGEQIGATRDAGKRLIGAHIELAKAEFGDIAGAIKRAAALIGLAIGAALVAALLVVIGTPLFLGEWLFGSIGWGILLGLLLMLAIAVAAAVKALDARASWGVAPPFIAAALIGIVVGVVLGLDLTNRGWTALGDSAFAGLDPASRPLIVAVASLALIGAVLGAIAGGLRGGAGPAIGGLVGGAVAGALLGVLTAIATGPRVGAAIGVATGLIAWVALMGLDIIRHHGDADELKERFMPDRTIQITKETIEWARERMPLSRRS
jgi:MFS family permease